MSPDTLSLLVVTVPLAGMVGLFVGSFLNVVVYRTPLGLSVAAPRSFCPNCDRQLAWWENVPVASWIGLRGRCWTCRQPISVRYPLVELATGVSFALVTWACHGRPLSAAYCVLVATLIAVSLIELSGQRAPLAVAAIGTAAGQLLLVVGGGWDHHWRLVIGSLVGTTLAVGVFVLLRAVDPECEDPRGRGRTLVLVAGCWIGGLGASAQVIGAAVWIVTYFVCMVGAWRWAHARTMSPVGSGAAAEEGLPPVLATPLVTALALAMAASLLVWA